jgi:RHS repeat-associated protein
LPSGAPIREYVWLGSTPVAVVTQAPGASSAEIFEIHADHLNTPRLAIDTQGRQRWTWLAEPFGNEAANPAPTANLGAVNIPLRHPGQYWDAESGLFYNHHRFYDPKIGRYIQSDLIGLAGGINTYAYADGNPVMYTDPLGLWAVGDPLPQGLVDFGAGMGDAILLGQGQRLRNLLGVNGGIDPCSSEYSAGEWAGVGLSVATGLAGGLKAAGAKGAGKEFSHWIPNRMGGPRTVWNGNYVPTATHAVSDPYRYRFMPRAWKEANAPMSTPTAQWTRIPNVYKGGAAGGVYGAAGAAQSGCTCPR